MTEGRYVIGLEGRIRDARPGEEPQFVDGRWAILEHEDGRHIEVDMMPDFAAKRNAMLDGARIRTKSIKDVVNSPDHYKRLAEKLGVETIQVIEALPHLRGNYHLGTAMKYLWRAGAKDDETQDIGKAAWYLLRHLLEKDPAALQKTLTYFQGQVDKRIPPTTMTYNFNEAGMFTTERAAEAARRMAKMMRDA